MVLRFVDEPPSEAATRYGEWTEVIEQLRAHPGRWTHLEPGKDGVPMFARPGGMASSIRHGRRACWAPAGTFAAAVRGGQLWVSYVGPGNGQQ